jgi:hypothetical protein
MSSGGAVVQPRARQNLGAKVQPKTTSKLAEALALHHAVTLAGEDYFDKVMMG